MFVEALPMIVVGLHELMKLIVAINLYEAVFNDFNSTFAYLTDGFLLAHFYSKTYI